MELDFGLITNEAVSIALLGYAIVFTVLLFLFAFFSNLPRILDELYKGRRRARKARKQLMANIDRRKRAAFEDEPVKEEVLGCGVSFSRRSARRRRPAGHHSENLPHVFALELEDLQRHAHP